MDGSGPGRPAAALLLLADGRFPAGGHAHSHGLEATVGAVGLSDVEQLAEFLEARLSTAGMVEAAAAAHVAGRLVAGRPLDWPALDAELDARIASPALRAVSRRLGRQLSRAVDRVWPGSAELTPVHPEGPHHAAAMGVVAAASGLGAPDAAALVLHHLATGVASAAVRLLGLDPYEVHGVLARTGATREALAATAAGFVDVEPAGLPVASVVFADVLAEAHAVADGRLFAS